MPIGAKMALETTMGPLTPQRIGPAGRGTGVNLSDYFMEHFSLAPGRGGDEYDKRGDKINGTLVSEPILLHTRGRFKSYV